MATYDILDPALASYHLVTRSSHTDLDRAVPDGVAVITTKNKVNGKYHVIGYFAGDNNVVLTNEAAQNPPLAGALTKRQDGKPGQLLSTDQQTGDQVFKVADVPAPATNNNGSTANPQQLGNASASGGAAPVPTGTVPGSDASVGNYGTGASTAVGDLKTGTLKQRYSAFDDTQQVYIDEPTPNAQIAANLSAMGGGNYNLGDPQQRSITALVNSVFSMTPSNRTALRTKLIAAGYADKNTTTISDLANSFESALQDLSMSEQNGNPKLTVDQFLQQSAAAVKDGQASGATTKTHNINSSEIDLTDPNAARGLVTNAITKALGRNPTADEISQFTASLQAAEKASPTVKSGTTTTDQSDLTTTSSNTTVQGGLADPSAYAQQWVEQNMPGQVHATDIGANLFSIIAGAMSPSGGG